MKEFFDIQQGIKCPKGTEGPGGKFKYRTTNDILTALRPLLAKSKCVLHLNCEVVEHCGKPYVKAIASIENEAGDSVTATYEAMEENGMIKGSQGTGSASTYAMKGALNCLLLMDDAVDPDSIDKRKSISPSQYEDAAKWCYDNGYKAEAITEYYKSSPNDIQNIEKILKDKYNQ